MLGVHDLDRLQAAFPDLQMELVGGKVIVMSPSDVVSSAVAMRFGSSLEPYVRERKLGRLFGPDAGFILTNGDLRAPDVSFVSFERLRALPHRYASVTPEFTVEVRSSSDRPAEVVDKLRTYLENGAVVGIYVDPREHCIRILRAERDDEILHDGDVIAVPELFANWSLAVRELWPVEAP